MIYLPITKEYVLPSFKQYEVDPRLNQLKLQQYIQINSWFFEFAEQIKKFGKIRLSSTDEKRGLKI
jgi:hypothetical protein